MSTSSAGGCGTSACSRRCRRGWSSWRRRTSTTCTAPPSPPCTSRSATATRCSTSTGCAATRRCRSSARSARGCRCTRPASARCCSPTRRPTCRRGCWPTSTASRPYTVTQPGRLRRQLAQVLRDDYATTPEEMSLGACSVAVPSAAAGRGGRRARPRRAQPQAGPARARRRAARSRRAASGGALGASGQRKPRIAAGCRDRDPDAPWTRCAPRSRSSVRARPACCCRTCSRPRASSRWSWRRASEEYVAVPDPRRHPRAVDRRPAARDRPGRAPRRGGPPAPRHLPPVARRAAPPRLRRPDRAVGVGLRPDRGAEGPRRGAAGRRASRSSTRSPTPPCTTSRPTARR